MFKPARTRVRRIVGRPELLLLGGSFLLAFALWFWLISSAMGSDASSAADYTFIAITAVILAAASCSWVAWLAMALAILLVPVFMLGRFLASLFAGVPRQG